MAEPFYLSPCEAVALSLRDGGVLFHDLLHHPARISSSNVFPVAQSNMEFLQNGLNVALIMFILSTSCLTAFHKLGVQDMFGETCTGHADAMAHPSKLILHYISGDAGHVGFLQDADVSASVLPADPRNLS